MGNRTTGRGLVHIWVGRWEGGAENILLIIQFTLRIIAVDIAQSQDLPTWPIHNVLSVSWIKELLVPSCLILEKMYEKYRICRKNVL